MKIELTYGGPIKGMNLWRFFATVALMGLWMVALFNQAYGFTTFVNGMLKHDFPNWLGYTFIVLLPLAETTAIVLLVIPKTNRYGFLLSSAMLLTFTGYIAAALFAGWASFDCLCSKFNSGWSWMAHFRFNLWFLMLAIAGLLLSLYIRKQGSGAEGTAAEGGSAKRPIINKILKTVNP
ncbi:MauE/DoxX family redox-associated membrane protein [Parapedobacter tibetensis]|uniref:MauE/DoxX family redox-associated membrane protein n=1 Tax=Parapedobacter tibetensis TaxID=2972951 RepID=UPI00214D8762|nr:MauE/DoxX family redox-associated membrane protein [Parapedobacter tibetensis]